MVALRSPAWGHQACRQLRCARETFLGVRPGTRARPAIGGGRTKSRSGTDFHHPPDAFNSPRSRAAPARLGRMVDHILLRTRNTLRVPKVPPLVSVAIRSTAARLSVALPRLAIHASARLVDGSPRPSVPPGEPRLRSSLRGSASSDHTTPRPRESAGGGLVGFAAAHRPIATQARAARCRGRTGSRTACGPCATLTNPPVARAQHLSRITPARRRFSRSVSGLSIAGVPLDISISFPPGSSNAHLHLRPALSEPLQALL